MNKKLVIISASSLVLLLILFGTLFFINQPSLPKTDTIIGNYYYVEKGQETNARILKPAIENYLNQDRAESTVNRKKRLEKYFTSDSPVIDRPIENTDIFINKTSAIVTSVTFTQSGDDGNNDFFVVRTLTTYYSGSSPSTISQTFWATIRSDQGKPKAYDLGVSQT